MMRRAAGFAVALLPALVFLWQDGYLASSDGMIHLYRLFELDRAIGEGVFLPRWFPLSAYGYGLPVLNYYPPLTYYLAELFHLVGAGYIVAIKLTIATAFVVAALAMFLFARAWLRDGAAFVAALAYAYSPYLLSDAYVRGNFPEMLALSLLPLALWGVARVKSVVSGQWLVVSGQGADSFVLRSLPFVLSFAAIILAHHLTALQFAALLLVYVAFLFVIDLREQGAAVSVRRSAVGDLLARVVAIVVALALTAFYWVPALGELNLVYVEAASLARFLVSRLIHPADFFAPSLAYTYLPQSDALKRAFGFPQTMLALLAGVVVLLQIVRSRAAPHALFFWLVVVVSIFMTLTPSAPLWYAIPPLRFMQFPWRFQILAAIGIAFLLGVWAQWLGDALARWRAQRIVVPFFALALIALGAANVPLRAFPLTDAQVDLTRADDSAYVVAQMGWGWTREFLPATVQEFENIYAPLGQASRPPRDAARLLTSAQITREGLYARALRVVAPAPFELSQKTFFFPGWQAYIDDAPAHTYPRGSLGLVSAMVPAGEHRVEFRFEDTPLRLAMNVVSLVTFVGALVCLFRARRRACVALLSALVIIAALLAWRASAPRAPTPQAVSATLDARVRLIGYTTERMDESLRVTLHWLALAELSRDYHSYAHLLDAKGNLVAQSDGVPDQSLTPTTRWLPGEIVADRRVIVWRDVAPGEYQVVVGMYLPLENGFQNLGERIELERVIR